jgi:hypothetical protein
MTYTYTTIRTYDRGDTVEAGGVLEEGKVKARNKHEFRLKMDKQLMCPSLCAGDNMAGEFEIDYPGIKRRVFAIETVTKKT